MTTIATQRAGWTSRGWMSFTVANGGVLHLGGALTTTPSDYLSSGTYLSVGIPQTPLKTRFAESGEIDGHAIAHAEIVIVSAGATDDPHGRSASDGSTPTTAKGRARYVG